MTVVGLGYVGLPLAVAFGGKIDTIGFDINEHKEDCPDVRNTRVVDLIHELRSYGIEAAVEEGGCGGAEAPG